MAVREYCTIRRWPSRLVTNRELDVMEYFWEREGPVTFRQMRRFVPGHPKTLRTLLDRLVRKGIVAIERKAGHRHCFVARMTPQDVITAQTMPILQRILGFLIIADTFESILRSRRSSPALKRIVRELQRNQRSSGCDTSYPNNQFDPRKTSF